jgi:hypothetical protein
MRRALVIACIIATSSVALTQAQSQTKRASMAKYETRYYLLHTDLETDKAREAAIRMTKMAEEYARRTSDFGGTVRKKLPFYLFADPEDYYATGAPRESSGRFNGTTLLAVAEDFGPKTWHIVQHEGFHQFADAAINADLPVWVNEGLAEYFGEAVFTGDGYVTGAIPQWRLERIRKRFEKNEFKSIREMMSMPISAWNSELTLVNYDQAWAMVQFLAHGEDGRYQKAFATFLGMLGKGQSWQNAWQKTFGDTRGFEQKWRDWWTTLPDHPTRNVYAHATVAALTSYLARATSQGQTFKDFEAFAAAAEVKHHPDDWLPQRLFKQAVESAKKMTLDGATFALAPASSGKLLHLRCTLSDGTRLTGRFTLRQGRVASIRTDG